MGQNNLKLHDAYKLVINWDIGELNLLITYDDGTRSIGIFSFEELDSRGRIVISNNGIVIIIKRTKKQDRLSFGLLDTTVPEDQQQWVNYYTAKLEPTKNKYAIFTFIE